jgi:hypothetical protein
VAAGSAALDGRRRLFYTQNSNSPAADQTMPARDLYGIKEGAPDGNSTF